jgi:hypothetical protein
VGVDAEDLMPVAGLDYPATFAQLTSYPQRPLKTERGDAVLLGGDEPHRREPIGERQP